jgi:hypothetical protein
VACVALLQRQRHLERLGPGARWLVTGVIAIPTGHLLGHQTRLPDTRRASHSFVAARALPPRVRICRR